MSEMQVMDPTGHLNITWNADNNDEVSHARTVFNEMVTEKKYRAFRVRKGGEQGEPITRFDPNAEQMILLPQLVGG